jgi:hypothetical protein
MSAPNDHTASFPHGISLSYNNGICQLTQQLISLLVTSRQNYDWPAGTGAAVSQDRIIALEASVRRSMAILNPVGAHQIVVGVSSWAGNNANSHAALVGASAQQQIAMQRAISLLTNVATAQNGINDLSKLPGISLVIASKIYRFCMPNIGAAVDRHSSYFFNSLPVIGAGYATNFRREWASGSHTASRLAIYQNASYTHNLTEYFASYNPVLSCIANQLNIGGNHFTCAATGTVKVWASTDVEMAAYYWWACNGAR